MTVGGTSNSESFREQALNVQHPTQKVDSAFGCCALSCDERGAYQAQLLLALFLCFATSAMLAMASAVQPV